MPELQPPTEAELSGALERALLEGDEHGAAGALRAGLDGGFGRARLFDRVVRPAMVAIGDQWADARITVADEHMATETLARVLGLVRAENTRATGLRIVLAAVEGERHVVGLRMATELLEEAGHRAFYLGPDVPTFALSALVRRLQPDVVALGATMPGSGPVLRAAVEGVREARPGVRILAGGATAAAVLQGEEDVTVLTEVGTLVASLASETLAP